MGTNVDCTRAAIKNAKRIVGICNPQMPRTFGDGMIHESHFDALVYQEFPLPEFEFSEKITAEEQTIGKLIAENLIQDGATMQFGNIWVPLSLFHTGCVSVSVSVRPWHTKHRLVIRGGEFSMTFSSILHCLRRVLRGSARIERCFILADKSQAM